MKVDLKVIDELFSKIDTSEDSKAQFNHFVSLVAGVQHNNSAVSLTQMSRDVFECYVQNELKQFEVGSHASFVELMPERAEMVDRLLENDVLNLLNEFSVEFENIYVLYFRSNFDTSEILHNWNDIKELNCQLDLECIYNFLNEAEIVPIYLNIDDFINIYANGFTTANVNLRLLKQWLLFRNCEEQPEEEFKMPELNFYEVVNFILLAGLKILALDNPNLFDICDLLHTFMRNYIYLRTNTEVLADDLIFNDSTKFLAYLQKHRKNLRDKIVFTEKQRQEVQDYTIDRVVSIEMFVEPIVDKKLIKQALADKLPKLEFTDLDGSKYFDEKKKDRVLGEQVPQPRVRKPLLRKPVNSFNNRKPIVKIDSFFERKPVKDITHDYKHCYNRYLKMKNDENNKNLNTKQLYKLQEIPELIYEIIEIPEIEERDYLDVVKILHLINTNQLLSCLKLISYITARVEKDKFISREYLCYLYFTKGIVYLKAQRYEEASTLFYNCLLQNPV